MGQQARGGGAYQLGGIEHGGVESDGIGQILPALDDLQHKSLARRHVDGVDQALQHAEQRDVPYRHMTAEGEHGQRE